VAQVEQKRLQRMAVMRSPAPGQRVPDGRLRRGALLVCCAGAFMAFLDTTIVNIAFPDIERTFHASAGLSALSWVVNGYNVVIAALLVPAGRAADRLGRRRAFVTGLLLFTGASAGCAAASSVGMLITLRLVQAAGAAVVVPTSLALLLPQFERSRRLSAVAAWGAASALAAGIGPSLGAVLVQTYSWRAVFLVNIPIGLIGAWGASRVLAEERESGPLPDIPGAGLLCAGIALIALGIVKGNEWGWGSAATLACLIGSVVLLTIVGARCVRHSEPVIDPRLLRVRDAALANLGALLLSIALYAAILNNVLFLTGVWHWSVLRAGLAISPAALITAGVARPAGELAERYGARAIIVPGALLYLVGMLLLSWGAGRSPSFFVHWLPGAAIAGVGMGLALPNLIGAALAGAPEEKLATGSGLNAAARQLGGVLGVALLVSILAASGPHALAAHRYGWDLSAGFALAAAASALTLSGRRRVEML
jgi:EmrB/QacA subfamily drug resistance transporter